MDIEKESTFADRLATLLRAKSACLKKYAIWFNDMVKKSMDSKKPYVFYQGSCAHCDEIDIEIADIKTKLLQSN